MSEQLAVEVHDAFGTVVASGTIAVRSEALTPAAAGRRARPGRLADQPMLLMNAEGSYVAQQPVNPGLPWYVTVRLAP